ncbi:MarR family winged helix-turn-helix transcriptional regulator [Curtobacterium sp. ME26]|uniref:MarR family winged helix-turn-helix transcriptional regulator n=1 Tax=Curtobacterium sp. ME26 TaxID=2744254 RepID=UPI0015F6505D|nr:MarR family transcriptional regulator [Curtobacterium sp. ME26]
MNENPEIADTAAFTDALRLTLRPLLRGLLADRVIPLGQLGVLQQLSVHDSTTAKELAVAERVSPQSMTVLVRELREKGLVAATPDNSDGRKVRLSITVAGKNQLDSERTRSSGWLNKAVAAQLSAAEIETIKAALPALKKLGKVRD